LRAATTSRQELQHHTLSVGAPQTQWKRWRPHADKTKGRQEGSFGCSKASDMTGGGEPPDEGIRKRRPSQPDHEDLELELEQSPAQRGGAAVSPTSPFNIANLATATATTDSAEAPTTLCGRPTCTCIYNYTHPTVKSIAFINRSSSPLLQQSHRPCTGREAGHGRNHTDWDTEDWHT
jgi:hypothetical protein